MTEQDTATPPATRPGVWQLMVDGGVWYMIPNLIFLGFAFVPFLSGDAPASQLPQALLQVLLVAGIYTFTSLATHWPLPARIAWLIALAGSIALLWPIATVGVLYFPIYVTVATSLLLPLVPAVIVIAITSLAVGALALSLGQPIALILTAVALIGGIALAFGRVIWERNDRLRAAEQRVATLAVAAERARIGQDLHDILGHSLTTITVKAQVVARLIERDPERALVEIADLEEIARVALADVRATASGMKSVRVAGEIASARSVLTAAGIQAETPSAVPELPDAGSELFGYVVREAVTNVIRHSGATHCAITIGAGFVQVTDDGHGGAQQNEDGSGLGGLRERATKAGFRLVISSGTDGTSIRAELA